MFTKNIQKFQFGLAWNKPAFKVADRLNTQGTKKVVKHEEKNNKYRKISIDRPGGIHFLSTNNF